jgi:hypothetical protein
MAEQAVIYRVACVFVWGYAQRWVARAVVFGVAERYNAAAWVAGTGPAMTKV